ISMRSISIRGSAWAGELGVGRARGSSPHQRGRSYYWPQDRSSGKISVITLPAWPKDRVVVLSAEGCIPGTPLRSVGFHVIALPSDRLARRSDYHGLPGERTKGQKSMVS